MDIATAVVAHLKHHPLFQSLEPSGPGFINIILANHALAEALQSLVTDPRLGVKPQSAETVVVDYANANVAKEMHVGHIRSIVIGDAIVRLLQFLGHHVVKQSHLGDWGTQFGMLIEYLLMTNEKIEAHTVSDLDVFYKKSKQVFDTDPNFAESARKRVVALQSGDLETVQLWKKLVTDSLQYFQKNI